MKQWLKTKSKTFTKNPIIGTKFTIAASSAKVELVNLLLHQSCFSFKKARCKVGLLDAEVYGPSLPKLFDIGDKPESDGQRLIPILKYDIQCMSIGFLTDEQTYDLARTDGHKWIKHLLKKLRKDRL